MRFVLALAITALLAFPAIADVKVMREAGADFGDYHSYAWREGTDAAMPDAQQWIVQAVERELEARGMSKVSDSDADFYVVTYAFAKAATQVAAIYVHSDAADIGLIAADVVDSSRGVLVVDLIDAESEKKMWRAVANEVMGHPKPEKVHKKIDKVTRKMFKDFPPR